MSSKALFKCFQPKLIAHKLAGVGLFTALLFGGSANAEVVDLGHCFTRRPLFVCQTWVKNLKPDDEVRFSDGHILKLGEFLNDGGSARVFALKDYPKVAIRIPHARNEQDFYFMKSWLVGWEQMRDLGVPVVKVIDPFNQLGEYQLVERLKIEFTYYDLVDARRELGHFPDTFRGHSWTKIFASLRTFARASYRLSQAAEGLQMGFDGTKWRMFDFGDENFGYRTRGKPAVERRQTIWGPGESTDPVFSTLENIVFKKRAQDCALLLN